MTATARSRLLLLLLITTAGVGALDAAIGRRWDLVVVQLVVVVLAALLAAGTWGHRTPVPLRRDLAEWLQRYGSDGGEGAGDVADRAVAAYRAGLTEGLHDAGSTSTGR